MAGAERVVEVARQHGLEGTRVGAVTGDDVLERMLALADQGVAFSNLDTGEESITRIRDQIVAANAYIGAEGIVEASSVTRTSSWRGAAPTTLSTWAR